MLHGSWKLQAGGKPTTYSEETLDHLAQGDFLKANETFREQALLETKMICYTVWPKSCIYWLF